MSERRKRWLVFGLLLLLSVGTRFWGLSWGLPNTFHVDENRFTSIALQFLGGDLNPHFFHVGTLHMYVLAGMWKVYGWTAGLHSQQEIIAAIVRDPTPFYMIGRVFSAVLGVATVLLIFLIGLRMFGLAAGGAAGLFLALSLEHVKISHAMLPDGPTIFLLVAAFYFAWRIYKTGRTKFYILAGLAAGAAMAMKYAGHMMALPVFVAHVARVLEDGRPKKKIILHPPLFLFGFVFLATFVVGCPYSVLDFAKFLRDFRWQTSHLMTQGHFGSSTAQPAWLFYFQYGFRYNLGLWIQYFAFLGTGLAFLRHKAREWILLAYPVVLFVMIGMWKASSTRYLLPLAPFFVLLAGLGAEQVGAWAALAATRLQGRGPGRRILPAGAFVLLVAAVAAAPSAVRVARYDHSVAGRDTRVEAKVWFHWNIPAGEKVAIEEYDPPISRAKYDTYYRHSLSEVDLPTLASRGIRYYIINDIDYARFTDYPKEFPQRASFYAELEREGTLIKTFRPAYEEELIDLHNPTIKIYRLPATPDYHFPGHFESFAAEASLEKTAGGTWLLQASMAGKLGPYVGERPAEPYVLLVSPKGKELARLVLQAGPVPPGDFQAQAFREIPAPPEGAQLVLGYLYDLAPDPLRVPPEQPFFKETTLSERVDMKVRREGRMAASFRYEKAAPPKAAAQTGSAVLR
jgi:4-amino-4-deoxy-L-arabinose transferase-like glycosyltransferase